MPQGTHEAAISCVSGKAQQQMRRLQEDRCVQLLTGQHKVEFIGVRRWTGVLTSKITLNNQDATTYILLVADMSYYRGTALERGEGMWKWCS